MGWSSDYLFGGYGGYGGFSYGGYYGGGFGGYPYGEGYEYGCFFCQVSSYVLNHGIISPPFLRYQVLI
ncbi:unnamed protein product [Rotaria sp. Silwood1]|nr:unnamed protein product [Rotaria sp. Silwood1]